MSDILIQSGGITITYGNDANAKLGTQVLGLLPGVSDNGDVGWACGYSSFTGGITLDPNAVAPTTVDGKYLPSSGCR